MDDPLRPDPDVLLASIEAKESARVRGKLKVFLGMAPGVGKTYAMLVAAQRARERGVDVVVGWIDTHGRPETEAQLVGLPALPPKKVAYRGTELAEFDLEAALARQPPLLLLDELAHTNAPGSRHAKRHQDVEDLLAAGIDVYTTLNVQHLESRADTVQQITGAPVHETVPDSILDRAHDVQLVDLTPEQLRQRLADGKVYLGERGQGAAEHFFQESNLTALRELALRVTAERVDQQLRNIRAGTGSSAIWRSGERLLVAVGPSPFSTRLVRWTRRMAYALDAPWLAVAVDIGRPPEPGDQKRLDENLQLARELGAEVLVVPGHDVAATLARVAHQHNVSQIVIGKPRGQRWIDRLGGGSLVDRLLRQSGQIDVYVVPAEPRTGRARWQDWVPPAVSRPGEYATAVVSVAGVTGLGTALAPYTGYVTPSYLYLTLVTLLGLFVGQGPILTAAILSAFAWNFLFIPPLLTFRVSRLEDGLMLGVFFVLATVTGRLTTRIRQQQAAERLREQRTHSLYQFSRAIGAGRSADEVIRQATARIHESFGARSAVFTHSEERLQLHPSATFTIDDKEWAVADWTYRHLRPAGRFTDTLPGAEGYYLPLLAGERRLGVLAINPPAGERLPEVQRALLESFASQLAGVLERELLRRDQENAALAQESARLHRALLDSVSHELKTPLAVIAGSAEQLATSSDPAVHSPAEEVLTASRRLQRLVTNLLDVARLESGAIRPRLDWCDLRDIVQSALEATADARRLHPTVTDFPAELAPVRVDFALIEQAVVNLLHNAALHTPAGTALAVSAAIDPLENEAWIAVTDHGPGLAPEVASRIFDRFSRGPAAGTGGLGLGLSIVRGFVEAHGGRVEVGGVPGGGARFTVIVPWSPPGQVPSE